MRTYTSLLFFLLPLLAVADNHHDARLSRRHKPRTDASRLESRGFRATFYDVGLGACGKTNSPGDFVIALNQAQFAGGSHCFEEVTISFQGKTTQAQIVDECMGCPYGGIDMSRGLFSFFADQSKGVISVDWNFGGGGGPKAAPSKAKPPPPKPSPTTSSSDAPKSSSARASSSSTTAKPSTSVSASAQTPVPSTVPDLGSHNLADLESLVGALGKLVFSAST